MSGPSKDAANELYELSCLHVSVTGQYGLVSKNHLESLSVVSNDVEIKT